MTTLLALLLHAAVAQTAIGDEEGADPATVLAEAKRLYFDGGHEAALSLLTSVPRPDGPMDDPVAAEILVYRGEIEYVTGNRAESWQTFRALLEAWPDYEISALHHPPEVVEWFDLVRREAVRSAPSPTPAPPPSPPPAWTFAPFGLPQARTGHRGAARVHASLQIGFGAVSLGVGAYLVAVNGPNHPPAWDPPTLRRRVATLRWGVQIPATLGFWTSYAISVSTGRRAWRAEHPGPIVGLRLGTDGRTLGISGRF